MRYMLAELSRTYSPQAGGRWQIERLLPWSSAVAERAAAYAFSVELNLRGYWREISQLNLMGGARMRRD
jgi:hypothetical protein